MPIHNAVDVVAVCLRSLARHALPARRILLLDDASTDPAIPRLLDRYRHRAPFVCERHPRNLGFTRTVNRGIALAGEDDVVLLNSDTQVTPGWLGRLRHAAYLRPQVGSVTAVSNNAGAFSVPRPGANAVPEAFGLERFARAIAQAAEHRYPEVPTGNGFCLYLRR
ncbi:MAG: glycosyltransferase family 2 protein, partial [Pseudomonadota bacterium]